MPCVSAPQHGMIALAAALLFACGARADEEVGNAPLVVASQYGRCFAKSVPASHSGQLGETKVYKVENGVDRLVHTFDWYSLNIFIECNVAPPGKAGAVAVVRMGPWNRGRFASASELAFAFYWGGQLVKQYSTLDIAGSETNVQSSLSHHRVVQNVEGFRWMSGNQYAFVITTTDGRKLQFDAATGERMP